MGTVLCFGTFDGLHPGHSDLFRQAREHGERLVVCVARDATVEEVKGRPPLFDEAARLAAVQSDPLVDEARLGYSDDRYRLIEEVAPDVIVLGYDQSAFTDGLSDALAGRGQTPTIVRAEPFHPDRYKSSLLNDYARHQGHS